ncbi:MAG: hypothetical protein ACJAZF_005218, partial [Granulosicoccus sp.]
SAEKFIPATACLICSNVYVLVICIPSYSKPII